MKPALLVADDDPVARDLLVEVLEREGYRVRAAGGGEECLRLAAEEVFDLALVDLRMPGLDGLAVLKRLPAVQPELPVLILTAFATMDSAVEAIGAGACDYLSKPFRMDEIRLVVRRTLAAQQLIREHRGYRQELRDRYRMENFVGQSPDVVAIYKLVARVARLDTTVLITGETGTGKELVARAIHYASHRAERAFVVVDCTALPETLFESELFGHERGAFTGAAAARRGLFETASGGTCLLDEIGELSPALQAKLLRVLQERAIRRLGGNDLIPIDLRIIAATNRNLKKLVEDGSFREDLYYRLHVVAIAVPSLRERAADIPLLVRHFLEKYTRAAERPVPIVSPETMDLLTAYTWPGNVRELEHALERAVALGPSPLLLPDDLPPEVRSAGADPTASKNPLTLEEMKRWYVTKVIRDCGGNKVRAAEVLGVDRRTLYRILEREGEGGEAGP